MIFDGNDPVGVKLDWAYDDFFSLVLTSDLGIDLDGDLQLNPAELAILTDAISTWPEDFGGDLDVQQNGVPIGLGPRQRHEVTYENGLVTESHIRPIAPVPDQAAPFTIRVYDPFYYVAYSLAGPVTIAGREGCEATVIPADLDRAYTLVEELLYATPASEFDAEEAFPEVGVEFADTIVIECAS